MCEANRRCRGPSRVVSTHRAHARLSLLYPKKPTILAMARNCEFVQFQTSSGRPLGLATRTSNFGRRLPVDFGKDSVEAPLAAEPRAKRNLTHWNFDLVQEPLCPLNSCRSRDLGRTCCKILVEQPQQVPGAKLNVLPSSRISRTARCTVVSEPFHAGENGVASGRHLRHGRNPSRSAAAAEG
jgi:hypothetical protein